MRKPVKSVIASARAMIRRPSEAKLATEDMRFFLHQVLEELHVRSQKENSDFFTHDFTINLTYDSALLGYRFSVDTLKEACCLSASATVSITDVIPVFLRYQSTDDNPQKSWYKIPFSRLTTYGSDQGPGKMTAAIIGNTWQGYGDPHIKLNVAQSFVDGHRWRLFCRVFPSTELDYDDMVPFPGEHFSLVEHMLAIRCLPLVRDESPGWKGFTSVQLPILMNREKELKFALMEWLNKDVENHIITEHPYHYRYNNQQLAHRRPIPVEANTEPVAGPPSLPDFDGGVL